MFQTERIHLFFFSYSFFRFFFLLGQPLTRPGANFKTERVHRYPESYKAGVNWNGRIELRQCVSSSYQYRFLKPLLLLVFGPR